MPLKPPKQNLMTSNRLSGAGGAGGAAGASGARGVGAASAGGAGAADQSQPQLLPSSPLPAPAPHTEVSESLTERREPENRASTPVRARHVARLRPPAVPGTHGMAIRPSFVPQRIVLLEPPASSLLHVPYPDSDLARATSPTIIRLLATVVTDPDLESTAAFALVIEQVDFAARSRLDYVACLVTESESVCPPSVRGELALGSDVLEDRQFELECLAAALPRFASMLLCPEGDPDALNIPTPHSYAEATASEYSFQWQIAMDAEMASWKSTGTYVDEVPPPGANIHSVTGSFSAGTQWSLRRPVYGLRQALREWHDILRTILAALGFAPSYSDPSLFLRTDTTLPPFYVLVYVDDLVFATTDTEALALVKAELQERHTCTDLGELRSYLGLQITRDRAGAHHNDLVTHGAPGPSAIRLPVLLATAHSYVYRPLALSSTFGRVRRAKCYEAEIYAGAMAAQELRWVTYLLSDLGERPRSPPVLLRRPVYGLRQAPREWHDTLRTTLAALGFAPSTADPSLFLRTDTTLPPFYVLVYVDDLVFATADTEALAHVKSELQKRHMCTDLGEMTSYLGLRITRDRAQRTITLTQSHMVQQVLQRFGFTYSSPQSTPLPNGHSLSAPPLDESVEPSGPYPELVGCLMYLMTCTRPNLAYPLSLLARYVAPGRHQKVYWDAAKRVLRYLCSTSGMGLVLGGRA
ncbi:unnamed protein product [Closterium sp. NIES-54]